MECYDYHPGNHIRFPVDVQPKLRGVRCLAARAAAGVVLSSKSGLPLAVPHVAAALAEVLPDGATWDGELYLHGLLQQETNGLVARGSERLEYHVFDVPIRNGASGPWSTRREWVDDLRPTLAGPLFAVHRIGARSHFEIRRRLNDYLREGYEGAVIRRPEGAYHWGRRLTWLQKVKKFHDEEFLVVEVDAATGQHAGCAIWICETATGERFRVASCGSLAERRRQLAVANLYVGRWLTVRYDGWSRRGVPQHTVADSFRIPEDLCIAAH